MVKYYFLILVFSSGVLFANAQNQDIIINPGYHLRFTGGIGDGNDGKIVSSQFNTKGLDIVGINNDINNPYRQIHLWGQLTQQENNGTNSFNGNSVFNAALKVNGVMETGVGTGSYFRSGNYLTMGHTVATSEPYLSFNAYLKTSVPNVGNTFGGTYIGPGASGLVIIGQAGQGSIRFIQKSYSSSNPDFNPVAVTPSLFLNSAGQVGIGCNFMDDIGYKMAVNGTVLATRVKVSQTGPWPDYVFEPTYPLRPLDSLEAFINSNKHLPDVLPAVQVEKDGIDLGENQAALLRKIEELTLYIIQVDKKLKEQQEQILRLQKRH